MADNSTLPVDALIEDTSDYGDFGSDAEEIEIIDLLLAQVVSKDDHEKAPPLLVSDIEDYEQPRGLFLPKDNTRQNPLQPEIEPDIQALRDNIKVETGTLEACEIYHNADILTSV